MNSRATILHADLDAFFVSMELLRHPELRGRPVIVVGGMGERGVVNTCSYEARVFGVHSAMAVTQARRLCPHGVYLPSDFAFYAPASRRFHAILRDFTPVVERAGSDEAYLDVAGSERLFGTPEEIAVEIRRRVREEIGITVSVGVASGKTVAKVASDANKPDGLCVVPAGTEAAFFAPRPLRDLPGIGAATASRLQSLGMRTMGDLQAASPRLLEQQFGVHGASLQSRARGIDPAPVRSERAAARSISREHTFEFDVGDRDLLLGTLRRQSERIGATLASDHLSARTVVLKLRFPPFETITRSHTATVPLAYADDVFGAVSALFLDAWRKNGHRPVRLLGTGVSGLSERAHQLRLGETPRRRELSETLLRLREQYGHNVLLRGTELDMPATRYGAESTSPAEIIESIENIDRN